MDVGASTVCKCDNPDCVRYQLALARDGHSAQLMGSVGLRMLSELPVRGGAAAAHGGAPHLLDPPPPPPPPPPPRDPPPIPLPPPAMMAPPWLPAPSMMSLDFPTTPAAAAAPWEADFAMTSMSSTTHFAFGTMVSSTCTRRYATSCSFSLFALYSSFAAGRCAGASSLYGATTATDRRRRRNGLVRRGQY